MRSLIIKRDTGSIPTYATEITDEGWTARLAGDVNTTLTVPASSRFALISASDFYFVSETAISLPSVGAGFTNTDTEQGKQVIFVEDVTTLNFRSRNDTDISVSFYR